MKSKVKKNAQIPLPTPVSSIRQRAQNLMNSLDPVANALNSWLPESDALKLIHELQVHQIELELQISELLLANKEDKDFADQYTELYDFSKAGYFSFSAEGKLVDLDNPTSKEFSNNTLVLKNKHFVFFVSKDVKPAFDKFYQETFESLAEEIFDVSVLTNQKVPRYTQLNCIKTENGERCLVTIIDITGFKKLSDPKENPFS